MSSVSSAGGSSLYQLLQQLQQSQQANQASTSTTSSATPATTGVQDNDGDTDGSSGSTGTATAHHGHHGHHGGLSTQLESAITSALASAGSSTDPNQVIQDAIKKFLQAGSGDTSGATAATATDPNSPSASNTATDPAAQQAAFAQTLASNGIDPKQFQQDLQAALQGSSSSGGSVDFSKLFANFPTGSAVNVLA